MKVAQELSHKGPLSDKIEEQLPSKSDGQLLVNCQTIILGCVRLTLFRNTGSEINFFRQAPSGD